MQNQIEESEVCWHVLGVAVFTEFHRSRTCQRKSFYVKSSSFVKCVYSSCG